MNIDFSRLYGNQTLLTMLSSKMEAASFAHAYLLEGPVGSGKKTLAFLLSAAICCQSPHKRPCGECPSCRKIYSAQSPDLYTVALDGLPLNSSKDIPESIMDPIPNSIGIDIIRSLRSDIYIKPNDLEKKLYIIAHADRMTEAAQNALLKVLEEPPGTAVFFLLCENRRNLLPTVLSRVQQLRMEIFDDETLHSVLTKHDTLARETARKDDTLLRRYIKLSGGTVGRTLRYLQSTPKELRADTLYTAYENAVLCLDTVFSDDAPSSSPVLQKRKGLSRPTRTELLRYLATHAGTRDAMRALIDQLCSALRDLTVCIDTSEIPLLFYPQAEQPSALAERCDRRRLVRTCQRLSALRRSIDFNANLSLLQAELVQTLFSIRARN